MTNYNLAERLYQIKKGLDKVISRRYAFSDSQDYKTETINIQEARDKISKMATELAQDERVEQEQNKIDDDEAKDNLEEDVNSTRNL